MLNVCNKEKHSNALTLSSFFISPHYHSLNSQVSLPFSCVPPPPPSSAPLPPSISSTCLCDTLANPTLAPRTSVLHFSILCSPLGFQFPHLFSQNSFYWFWFGWILFWFGWFCFDFIKFDFHWVEFGYFELVQYFDGITRGPTGSA